MGSSLRRAMALVATVLMLGACDGELSFRSLTVNVRIAKDAEDPAPGGAFSAEGPILTADPDLSCKRRRDARPRSSTIECVRTSTEETVSASFSCPDTGAKTETTTGWLVVNSPKLHLSHSFSADCAYGR
jgi:hypothetical protein